jgi:DNA-binding NarL/FixJ family response regulator
MTQGQSAIRVLAVDDHAILRSGIRALIGAESDIQLVQRPRTGVRPLSNFERTARMSC